MISCTATPGATAAEIDDARTQRRPDGLPELARAPGVLEALRRDKFLEAVVAAATELLGRIKRRNAV